MNRINYNCTEDELYKYSISKLKRVADYWLRKLLMRYSKIKNNGSLVCFLTGRAYGEEDLHVAHLFPRGNMSVRYDEHNCNLINKWSNTFDDQVYDEELYGKGATKHIFQYTNKFISEFGEEKYEELKSASEDIIYRDKDDYVDLILQFREASSEGAQD